jgi:FkbM family methyltransferase
MHARAYETEIIGLLRKLLRPGDTFVDVGANIGYLSAMAAARVGQHGRILSFEPAPRCFARLEEIWKLNPGYRWEARQLAIGATNGSSELALSTSNMGWNTLVPHQIPVGLVAETISVPVRRLDDCLQEAGVEHVRLLKIDVEGYEGPVILGAESYLRERRIEHIVMEVRPPQYPALGLVLEEIVRFLWDCGYTTHETRRPYRRIGLDGFAPGADVWLRLD